MLSLAVRRCGSRGHSRRGPNRNGSRATSSAVVAAIREVREQKAHVAPGRVLSNSTKLRNGKAVREVSNHGKVVVASSVTNAKLSVKLFDMSHEGWPAGHPSFIQSWLRSNHVLPQRWKAIEPDRRIRRRVGTGRLA